MNYLQMAKDAVEQSEGDIRWDGQKERLMELATVYAAIAQAEALAQLAQVAQVRELDRQAKIGRIELRRKRAEFDASLPTFEEVMRD